MYPTIINSVVCISNGGWSRFKLWLLGALSARKNKKNASEDEKYDSLIEHAIEETDGNEKIDLPILSAKQIYAILKERLDNLEIAKLSQEQKILYKKFVEKTGEE